MTRLEDPPIAPQVDRVSPPLAEIMGLAVQTLDEAATVHELFSAIARGEGGWLVTPNLDVLRQVCASREVHDLVSQATLVVVDGMPLVWAAAVAGRPVPARVAGSTLIYALSVEAARRGDSVFLLGGAPGTAVRAAEVLCESAPGLRLAGTYCPPFGFESDPAELELIVDALRAARPAVVFVGLSFPKQERLIASLRTVLPSAYFAGLGVSFSFVAGDVKRAPHWVQRIGLEWVHRLVQEPRRLFRRYIIDDIPFAVRLFAWAARVRLRRLLAS